MHCPFCASENTRVVDSRYVRDQNSTRRRRRCDDCERRFTTYERVEETAGLVVIKRDGSRVPFDRERIVRGVQLACGKRPIPEDDKAALVDAVDDEIHQDFDREVPSSVIGEKVMRRLKDLDEVAYVRFASEHYQFGTVGEIRRHAEELETRVKDAKNQQPLF